MRYLKRDSNARQEKKKRTYSLKYDTGNDQ